MSRFEERLLRNRKFEDLQITPDQEIQVDSFISRLKGYGVSGVQATLPVIGSQGELLNSYYLENHGGNRDGKFVKGLVEKLPVFQGDPLKDSGAILELAKRLNLFPRKFPDNCIYSSSVFGEYVAGWEIGSRSAIYNCLRVRRSDFPKYTYWHEIFADNTFGTEAKAVFVTVNRGYRSYQTILPSQ